MNVKVALNFLQEIVKQNLIRKETRIDFLHLGILIAVLDLGVQVLVDSSYLSCQYICLIIDECKLTQFLLLTDLDKFFAVGNNYPSFIMVEVIKTAEAGSCSKT